nr:3-deoxy-7-phosphoheptulonate synthase [Ruminococcus sp.]
MAMNIIRELPHPDKIKSAHPLPQNLISLKAERDRETKDIFSGKSDKFLLIIGPCSADREDSVLDYITRLREVQE